MTMQIEKELKEQIAETIGAKHGETKPCRICSELSVSIVALVRESVEKVENPNNGWENFRFPDIGQMRYLEFEQARQAILKELGE